MKQGVVHINSGQGKGKTIALVVLTLRALEHGFNETFSSFSNLPNEFVNNKIDLLKSPDTKIYNFSKGRYTNPQITKGVKSPKEIDN